MSKLYFNFYIYFKFKFIFAFVHIQKVVSTFVNVVKLDVKNDNVVSTQSNVVNINVEIHHADSRLFNVVNFNGDVQNIALTLIWYFPTSQRHINLVTTSKQRLNVCWVRQNRIHLLWEVWILLFNFLSRLGYHADHVYIKSQGKSHQHIIIRIMTQPGSDRRRIL